jgi:hypothetical protein
MRRRAGDTARREGTLDSLVLYVTAFWLVVRLGAGFVAEHIRQRPERENH